MRPLLGVNVPYFGGAYGHDLAPNGRFPTWPVDFDPMRTYRPLLEARALGFEAVRTWLCENGEGIVVDGDGRIDAVHERLLEAVRVLQECALLGGVRLYLTLLDANAYARESCPITGSVLSDAAQAERFAERVVKPICQVLDPRAVMALEIVNEPDSATADCLVDASVKALEWGPIGAAIRVAGDAARSARDGLLVTSGTNAVFLPKLWATDPRVDAVDVHVYHTGGGLPPREHLARTVRDARLEDPSTVLIAGECGIPKPPGPDEPTALCNFLYNARRLDYQAAFLWKLEGDLLDPKHERRRTTSLGLAVQEAFVHRADWQ